jgi:hypothetical protein
MIWIEFSILQYILLRRLHLFKYLDHLRFHLYWSSCILDAYFVRLHFWILAPIISGRVTVWQLARRREPTGRKLFFFEDLSRLKLEVKRCWKREILDLLLSVKVFLHPMLNPENMCSAVYIMSPVFRWSPYLYRFSTDYCGFSMPSLEDKPPRAADDFRFGNKPSKEVSRCKCISKDFENWILIFQGLPLGRFALN